MSGLCRTPDPSGDSWAGTGSAIMLPAPHGARASCAAGAGQRGPYCCAAGASPREGEGLGRQDGSPPRRDGAKPVPGLSGTLGHFLLARHGVSGIWAPRVSQKPSKHLLWL